ncbi:MAG: hypothetical protein WCV86_03825 [Patescibacteria group bacterium]
MQKLAMALIVLGIFFVFGLEKAQALTIIPPSTEFQVDPGETYETTIKLFNETQSDLTLYTDVRNFTQLGETGTPNFDFDAELAGLASYITVTPGPIPVGAGERVEVAVKIAFPLDAEPGGAYASVFFTETPPVPTAPGQVAISSKLGSLLIVRVSGDILEMGAVSDFGTEVCNSETKTCAEHGGTYNRLPIEFFMRYTNTGNVHLRPSGTIAIKNILGGTTATLEMNDADGATLPDSTRKYTAVWEKERVNADEGNIWTDFWQEFGNEWRNFGLGRYTAMVTVTAGEDTIITDTGTLTLWIWPWRVLVISLLVLVALVLIIFFGIKRYNAHILKKAAEQQGQSKPSSKV